MKTRFSQPRGFASRWRSEAAFTMVEIALCLAVVSFALVAILGVLPTGLQVQRDNREETIINADGAYLMEAIRSGNDPLGRLTNAVYLLTVNFNNGDHETFVNDPPTFDGQRIIGLLSTPKAQNRQGVSNVVAWVRAMNSTAIDLDPDARDLAYRYQVVAEIIPFMGYPPALTNRMGTNELARLNRLQGNLHEIRLTMRWPLFRDDVRSPQNARVGGRRRTFRSLVGGRLQMIETNVLGDLRPLFFFQPSTY